LLQAHPTMRTFRPLRMKVALYPGEARLTIHEVYDWKVHAAYCT
jgi:hypothetical protein